MRDADRPERLLLAGYLMLKPTGFALPCYAVSPRPNAWHVARTAIQGDHAAAVVGFEEYAGGQVANLPEGMTREVALGDPWVDVFLLDGEPYVGTSSELLAQLVPRLDELERRAPLSALDLALSADRAEGGRLTARLASAAEGYLAERRGPQTAHAWQEGTFRSNAILRLRRMLSREPLDANLFLGLAAKADGQHVVVEAPVPLMDALASVVGLDQAHDELKRLGEDLGMTFVDLTPRREPQLSAAEAPQPQIVLALTVGRRQRAVERLLDFSNARRWSADLQRDAGLAYLRVASGEPLPDPRQIAAMVILLDETESKSAASLDLFEWVEEFRSQGGVVLLAPTPAPEFPSTLLSDPEEDHGLAPLADAVVDTSLARSPFATQARQSFDSRVAQIVSEAAILAVSDPAIRKALKAQGRVAAPPLLQIADGKAGDLMFASEAWWPTSGALRFNVDLRAGRRGREPTAQLCERNPDFGRLAEAALAMAVGSSGPVEPIGLSEQLLQQLGGGVPDRAAAFSTGGSMVLVTLATPTLEQAVTGAREGVAVVRYTDVATLRELGRSGAAQPVPAELLLDLEPLPENRGLFRRGVDKRDLVHIPPPAAHALRTSSAGVDARLADAVGRYRRAVNPPSDSRFEQPNFVMPGELFEEALRRGEPTIVALADQIGELRAAHRGRPPRRLQLSGLFGATSPGAPRYAVPEIGDRLRIAQLDWDEVPASTMLVAEGDAALPALILSRCFRIWAYATTTRLLDTRRILISRTFETFPLPKGMSVWSNGPVPVLRLEEGHDLAETVRGLEAELSALGKWPQAGGPFVARPASGSPALDRVDELILAGYDLPPQSSDLSILARLVEFNRASMRRRGLRQA